MKQASDIYNKLPERNFTRVKLLGKGEENEAKFIRIQLAKKRAYSIREFFIGIGCVNKHVKLDLSSVPTVILFKPKAKYSISGKIKGNLTIKSKITLKKNAHLEGDLKAAIITLEEGAKFDGMCSMVNQKLNNATTINRSLKTANEQV